MFLNILVGLDGSPSSQRALEHAAELAQAGNAKLTLVTVAPLASSYVALAGVSPEAMQAEIDRWATKILEDASASLPDDVSAQRVQHRGHAGHEILKELQSGGYDLIVLGSRGRNRAEESLLGSVNGYIHYHGHVPLLTVP
jgi:nucleotide-binding universal stress UspA family protein